MTRIERLQEIFKDIAADQRDLVDPLLHEVSFLEERMLELRKMPSIITHPKNKAVQKKTEAWKQYRECSQLHANDIRILVGVLNKSDTSAADELMKRLEEF